MTTFNERVNHRAAQYLLSQLSPEFLESSCGAGEEGRLTQIKNILQKFAKDGTHTATYKKSKCDQQQLFRSYGDGLQGMPTRFRGILCDGLMTDLDIINCYPTILLNICRQKDIPCNYLQDYCARRKELVDKGIFTKIDILKIINKKTKVKEKGDPWLVAFDTEMKAIQTQLVPHYPNIFKHCVDNNKSNLTGSFMTCVCMWYENMILEEAVRFIRLRHEVAVLMFDGLMIYGTPSNTLLQELSDLILAKFNFKIGWSVKEHDASIVVPDDFSVTDPNMVYQMKKTKFETDYGLAFIISNVSYAYKVSGVVRFYKQHDLLQILCTEGNFFARWCADPSRKTYDDIGVFPHDVAVPASHLNIWTGFAVEKLKADDVDIERIHKHLRILVNHDEASYLFMLKWLANLFQFPSSTSIFVNWASEEGAGKSCFISMLTSMIGKDKSAEITDLSDGLFGTFNSQYRDIILMNINEVERLDSAKCYERLKSAIDSPTIQVHGKGEKVYSIANLRKFIGSNNNVHGLVLKKGNRRYFSTECSNELVGNIEYFDTFIPYIERPDVQYSFYKFLMDYETPRKLTVRDIPETDLMREAYALSRDPVEDFVEQLPADKKLYTDELYVDYKQFMHKTGMEFVMNYKQFSMRFARAIKDRLVKKGKNDCITDGERDQRIFYILKCDHTP